MAKAHWLPNDNVLIWTGTVSSDQDSNQVDNILVLAGGDILFLKAISKISSNNSDVLNEISTMKYTEFNNKYGTNIERIDWKYIQSELGANKLPPYQYNLRRNEYGRMINNYITTISRYGGRTAYNECIDIIENIINRMGSLKGESVKENVKLLKKLISSIDKL